MTLLALTVATAFPVGFALLVGYWNLTIQRAFWASYIAAHGRAPRTTKSPFRFRIGLDLDDYVVSWLDWEPASRVLGQSLDDPVLEALRKRARRAGRIHLASLPLVLIAAFASAIAFGTIWLIPLAGGGAAWALGQGISENPGLRYSRPDIGEFDRSMWLYYLLPMAIVGGTLLTAGVLIAVVQMLRA